MRVHTEDTSSEKMYARLVIHRGRLAIMVNGKELKVHGEEKEAIVYIEQERGIKWCSSVEDGLEEFPAGSKLTVEF